MDFRAVLAHSDLLIHGMALTALLSVGAMFFGTALAILLALLRLAIPRTFGPVVASYVTLIRNTPLLVQLLLVYFGLPLLGFRLSAVGASLLTLSVNLGAYAVEIIRAGIESITRGQVEAGLALALPYRGCCGSLCCRKRLRMCGPHSRLNTSIRYLDPAFVLSCRS